MTSYIVKKKACYDLRDKGVTSTINDTWVNGTLINEGDKRVHAKIDAMRS